MDFESPNFGTPADKPDDHEEKQRQWDAKLVQLRTVADYEGKPIDSGIIETVAALNVNEFNTVQSCEGHLDEGIPVPWVAVESPNEPAEQFIGQGEIYAEVAQKYGLSVDDLIHTHNMEALQEANERVMKNPETPQFTEWQRQNLELKQRMEKCLAEFYQNRKVPPEIQLSIDSNRYHAFKLHNGGADFDLAGTKLTEEERAQVAPRLQQYQAEMNEFKEFLKGKYFGERLAKKDFMSEKDLLDSIKAESSQEKIDYFEIAKKIESLEQKEAEIIWYEIGKKLNEIGVFTNLKQEGIDVFKSEKEWKSPFKINALPAEMVKERLGSDYGNIGGYYSGGEVFISEDEGIPNATKDNIAFVAAGYGLGRKTETLIHETYHGFQDIDPEEIRKYQQQINELEDKIKAAELASQITGKPAYDSVGLRYRREELVKELQTKMSHPELDSEEKIFDRKILMEIHAHMFADPLKYAKGIRADDKNSINESYFEFPVTKIHESLIGVKRESEDKNTMYRYDYMKGKEQQAYVAFRQIEALRVLDLNNLEIGQIISDDEYDVEKGHYKKIRERIRETIKNRGVTDEQFNEMIVRYRLETVYKALKARNLARDIIKNYKKS